LSRALAGLPLALLVAVVAVVAAGCATPDPEAWFRYQVAGESATLHARYGKAAGLLERARAQAATPAQHARTDLAFARLAREQDDLLTASVELAKARAQADTLPSNALERLRIALEDASIELAAGRTSAAALRFAEVEREAVAQLGEADPLAGYAAGGRGEALRRAGDADGARRELDVALERFTGTASIDHVKPSEPLGLVAARTSLGRLDLAAGRLEEARTALREAAGIAGEELGTDHPLLADVLAELALVELALGDRTAADRAADRAVAIAASRLPADHPIRVAAVAAQERCAAAP
jgi:tetratricopeptide (TPR) repeat protein